MGRTLLFVMMAALVGLTTGCDGDGGGADAGSDAGPGGPSCPPPPELPSGDRPDPSEVECPTVSTPAPEEQMGTCCWRHSNADQLDSPELRLTYLRIVAPVGSTLTSGTLATVLNQAMQEETFNWLIRAELTESGDQAAITTGFGRRGADGTYAFSSGAAEGDPDSWCPVSIDATVDGETISSDPIEGSITVPIFDDEGENVQIELTLREIAIGQATLGEDRSCVGWKTSRNFTYHPEGVLTAFIEVETARTGMIEVPPIETTVCTAIAGENLSDVTYCDDTPQSEWKTPPDSLCDETGCRQNTPCETDVCDPAVPAAEGGCNAWALVAQFAAAGVDITNGACGS